MRDDTVAHQKLKVWGHCKKNRCLYFALRISWPWNMEPNKQETSPWRTSWSPSPTSWTSTRSRRSRRRFSRTGWFKVLLWILHMVIDRGRRTRIKMDGDEGERGAVGPWDAEADRWWWPWSCFPHWAKTLIYRKPTHRCASLTIRKTVSHWLTHWQLEIKRC